MEEVSIGAHGKEEEKGDDCLFVFSGVVVVVLTRNNLTPRCTTSPPAPSIIASNFGLSDGNMAFNFASQSFS